MSVPWFAASALPRCALTRKQARTPIDVTSSLTGTRDAKNQVRAEPAGTVQPSPTVRSNNSPTDTDSPTVRNCHQLAGAVRNRHPALTNCQDDGSPILLKGDPTGQSLKQTSGNSSFSIGASFHVINRQPRDHPFLTRARCYPK